MRPKPHRTIAHLASLHDSLQTQATALRRLVSASGDEWFDFDLKTSRGLPLDLTAPSCAIDVQDIMDDVEFLETAAAELRLIR